MFLLSQLDAATAAYHDTASELETAREQAKSLTHELERQQGLAASAVRDKTELAAVVQRLERHVAAGTDAHGHSHEFYRSQVAAVQQQLEQERERAHFAVQESQQEASRVRLDVTAARAELDVCRDALAMERKRFSNLLAMRAFRASDDAQPVGNSS